MDKLTFMLSVVGSVGTVYSLVATILLSRVKIDFDIFRYYRVLRGYIIYASFVNRSHLSVSVTDVRLTINGTSYGCSRFPSVTFEKTQKRGNDIISFEQEKSLSFPINLPVLSGTSGFLAFPIPPEIVISESTALTVELSTNRHCVVKKKLRFSPDLVDSSFL